MNDDSDDEQENVQFKIILIGDGAVGKTSIAMRFTDDSFNQRRAQLSRVPHASLLKFGFETRDWPPAAISRPSALISSRTI